VRKSTLHPWLGTPHLSLGTRFSFAAGKPLWHRSGIWCQPLDRIRPVTAHWLQPGFGFARVHFWVWGSLNAVADIFLRLPGDVPQRGVNGDCPAALREFLRLWRLGAAQPLNESAKRKPAT
jgi:hypothetical protein